MALSDSLGFISVIIGHFILHATSNPGYDASLASSMILGAVGGAILCPLWRALVSLKAWLFPPSNANQDEGHIPPATFLHSIALLPNGLWGFGEPTMFGAFAGIVGSVVLPRYGHAILDLDHAARAGALGGTVIVLGEYDTREGW